MSLSQLLDEKRKEKKDTLVQYAVQSYGHIYRALKVVLHSVTPLAKTKQHTGTNVVVQRWLDGGKNVPEEQET